MAEIKHKGCKLGAVLVVSLSLVACAGVSEKRLSAIEGNLKLLDQNAAKKIHEHDQRLIAIEKAIVALQDAMKAQVEEYKKSGSGKMRAQIKKLQATIETIQKRLDTDISQLQKDMARFGQQTSAPGQTSVVQSSSDIPLYEISKLLSVGVEGPNKIDDDAYDVSREWLLLELKDLVQGKKRPKFKKDKRRGGVKLTGVKSRDALGRLGFRSNDVILQFNDIEVESPSELFDAIKVASGELIKVTFKRGSKTVQYTYTIK